MASPGKAKPKPKKEKPDKSQAECLKEMALIVGADQTGAGFERAFQAISPQKSAQKRLNHKL